MDRTAKAEADLILHKITRTNHWGTRVQTGEWVGIFWRFLWYTGAGLLVSSIAALAVRSWLPESMHMPLSLVVHSLCGGVVAVSLLRTLSRAKTGSTLHNVSSANKACQLVVSVEGFLSRADVRGLVERRREAARIRSDYYDYLPPWARPIWGVR